MDPSHLQNLLTSGRQTLDVLGHALEQHRAGVVVAAEDGRDRVLEALTNFKTKLQRPLAHGNPKRLKPLGSRSKTNPIRPRGTARLDSFLVSSATAAELQREVTPPAKSATAPSTSEGDPPLHPTLVQFFAHPVALLRYVPKDAALFCAGALSGATAKTLTAPLDRWKLLLQVKSLQTAQANVAAVAPKVNLLESFVQIGKEEGVLGYWKGNLPQVIRIIPYSAVQLFAYETYKKLFKGKNKELTVPARLAAGACAGMTSSFITYPLDVLRLRLAVEPGSKQMTAVALRMLQEEGPLAFYKGLGPTLISIAPYIALNFCAFDLVKKSLPEEFRNTPQGSLVTALSATAFATIMCYPLDTIRRQMQMKNSPKNVFDAVPGILKRDGVSGLYRGFIANALKNLPNSSIRLTMYDTAKRLIASSNKTFDKLVEERRQQDQRSVAQSASAV